MLVSRLREKKTGPAALQSVSPSVQIASNGTSGECSAVSLVSSLHSPTVQRSACERVTFASASSVNNASLRNPYLNSLR
ncbi:hypothetical protein SALBM311S_03998 [Streptomyces alboniger]